MNNDGLVNNSKLDKFDASLNSNFCVSSTNKIWVITSFDDLYMISNDERCIWTNKDEALVAYKKYIQFWEESFCKNSWNIKPKPVLKEYIFTGNVYYDKK